MIFKFNEIMAMIIRSIRKHFKAIVLGIFFFLFIYYLQTSFSEDSTNNFKKICKNCDGENGSPVILSKSQESKAKKSYSKDFYNKIASDRLSLWRSLPDYRLPKCRNIKYSKDLPKASVVIVFNNEHWSPLLRTVYSVINRSPKNLLQEIILVDDYSNHVVLKKELENYCKKKFGDLVKIIRTEKRLGSMGAKNLAANEANGDVIVFLDSHCEVTTGWLEPLIDRIKSVKKAVVCPVIDIIDYKTMEYIPSKEERYGSFKWSLEFNWTTIPQRVQSKRKSKIDPYPSPVMSEGIFAISKEFFLETGGYDDGLEIAVGDNFELSFKTWLCGGVVEFIPCSRVGHMYKPGRLYSTVGLNNNSDVFSSNLLRVAETWMDDHKRLFYLQRPDQLGKDFGDITKQLIVRKNLNCHNFRWYLDFVYPEKFIPDENVFAYGDVINPKSLLCFDTLGQDENRDYYLGIITCSGGSSVTQVFSWTDKKEIRREDLCLESTGEKLSKVLMTRCNGNELQRWKHFRNGPIVHNKTNLCLDATDLQSGDFIVLKECEVTKTGQNWMFVNYD